MATKRNRPPRRNPLILTWTLSTMEGFIDVSHNMKTHETIITPSKLQYGITDAKGDCIPLSDFELRYSKAIVYRGCATANPIGSFTFVLPGLTVQGITWKKATLIIEE